MTSSETEPELLRDRGILVRLSYTLQPGGGGVPLAHHLCTIIVIAKERPVGSSGKAVIYM